MLAINIVLRLKLCLSESTLNTPGLSNLVVVLHYFYGEVLNFYLWSTSKGNPFHDSAPPCNFLQKLGQVKLDGITQIGGQFSK